MTMSGQRLKIRYAALLHTAAVCAKLKTFSKLITIDLHLELFPMLFDTAC